MKPTLSPLALVSLAPLLAASLSLLVIAAGYDSSKSDELNSPLPPVTLRYIPETNSSKWADQPTFWVTNHTDKTLSIKLQTIEIRNGQVWTTYCQAPVPGLLYFRQSLSREAALAPHAAGFGEMMSQRVTLPTNQVWRARASVAEKLVGGEAVVAAVKQMPQNLQARLATGNTNIPVNPFRKGVTRLGHHSEATSEAVLVTPLATADAVRVPDAPKKPARPSIYDESLDGFAQIVDALAVSQKENKRILLQFGANWCGWCHLLHKLFETDRAISERLKAGYVVVLIDVNKEHNKAVITKYGDPTRFGLPVIVILDSSGKQLITKNTAELEEGNHHNPAKVLAFLKEWAPKK